VTFEHNAETDTIDIIGRDLARSRKFKNIEADGRVSFVVDDLASREPWRPRGIEIRGRAQALKANPGETNPPQDLIRIHPQRVMAWGLDTDAFGTTHAREVIGEG